MDDKQDPPANAASEPRASIPSKPKRGDRPNSHLTHGMAVSSRTSVASWLRVISFWACFGFSLIGAISLVTLIALQDADWVSGLFGLGFFGGAAIALLGLGKPASKVAWTVSGAVIGVAATIVAGAFAPVEDDTSQAQTLSSASAESSAGTPDQTSQAVLDASPASSTATRAAKASKTVKPTDTPKPSRTPTSTMTPKATSTPTPTPTAKATFTPTNTPTSTPVPEFVDSAGGPITFRVFEGLFGIRVHFVTSVTNTGNVPIEISNLRYEMLSPSGAVIEVGEIPQSYPRKIGPGQTAAIGRTITADAATRVSDVAQVRTFYSERKVNSADNLITVVSASYRGADEFGQVLVVGDLRNDSGSTFDNVNIAVVLVDASGTWIGYATARIAVSELRPGQVAQFVTNADLPNQLVRDRVADILVFAFDK